MKFIKIFLVFALVFLIVEQCFADEQGWKKTSSSSSTWQTDSQMAGVWQTGSQTTGTWNSTSNINVYSQLPDYGDSDTQDSDEDSDTDDSAQLPEYEDLPDVSDEGDDPVLPDDGNNPGISYNIVDTNQISQFGITWTFDKDYRTGQFANGDYWVVGPVTIVEILPVSTSGDGRVMNGSMINPSPTDEYMQGYDTIVYSQYGPHFDSALNVARPGGNDLSLTNPLVVQPGSSLVSAISKSEVDPKAQLRGASILTILAEPAAEGSFRPAYCGSDKTIKFNKSQLNYSKLKSLKPVSIVPDLAVVERYFERPWIMHVPGWMGRFCIPTDNSNYYDRDISTQVSIGALMLHLNFTNQQKEKLLISYVQVGIDLYGVIQNGGGANWWSDSGRKYPILFAGIMLDDDLGMKNIGFLNDPEGTICARFEEDESTFYVTQADVDMCNSDQWNPDTRALELIPYTEEDIGLPEWRVVAGGSTKNNKWWGPGGLSYRSVTFPAYTGFCLAVHIMGAKDLWNHDVFFDYSDRYRQTETVNISTSQFALDMWDVYRSQYGPVWPESFAE